MLRNKLCLPMLIALGVVLSLVVPKPTYAIEPSGLNPIDPSKVTIEFISRYKMRVTISQSERLFKSGTDSGSISDHFSGVYEDSNGPVNGNGSGTEFNYSFSGSGVEAFIDQFNDGSLGSINDTPGAALFYKTYSEGDIRNFVTSKPIELTLAISDGSDVLYASATGQWEKTKNSFLDAASTLKVGDRVGRISNFNIVFSSDGNNLIDLYGSNHTYTNCNNNTFAYESCTFGASNDDRYIETDQSLKGNSTIIGTYHDGPQQVPVVIAQSESDVADNLDDGGSGNGSTTATCSSEVGPLGWMICPIMTGSLDFLEGLVGGGDSDKGFISNILKLDIVGGQESSLRTVWSGFRAMANLGFVIAFFFIIYSAASGNAMSAYDIKRMLPRLLIAVIAVQLSFFVCLLLLDVFNDLGSGAGAFVLAPLPGNGVDANNFLGNLFAVNPLGSGQDAAGIFAGATAGTLAGISIALIIIVAAVFSIVGILIMSVVFILRNLAIIVLIVLSPLAFVAWILPNTESMFKKWWGFFIQLLAIFPIAAIFFASGRLVAYVWTGGTSGFTADNILSSVLGTVAIFAPYFLAPKMFQFAGGAMQNAFNAVENIKKKGGESRIGQQAKSGNLIDKNSRLAKTKYGSKIVGGLNTATRATTNPLSTHLNPIKGSRTRRYSNAVATTRALEDEDFKNQKMLQAETYAETQASGGNTEAALLREIVDGLEVDKNGKPIRFDKPKAGVSHGAVRAAVERMTIDNNFEQLTELMTQLSASDNQGDRLLAGKLIEDNISTWSQKAPQLYKGAHGSTAAANAITADQIGSMHPNGIKGILNGLGKDMHSDDTKTATEANEAYANLVNKYRQAMSNPNTASRIGEGTRELLGSPQLGPVPLDSPVGTDNNN